jgi:uncharacterized protein
MTLRYQQETFGPRVRAAQREAYGRDQIPPKDLPDDVLGPAEVDFIAARDSFYLGSVGEHGWPYVQHRGGEAGFLKVLEPGRLAWGDFSGNRQLLSAGNVAGEERVSLFLMDYVGRRRLKILGRARVVEANAEWTERLFGDAPTPRLERIWVVEVVAFDWNCPQYIQPRYPAAEVEALTARLKARVKELEAELAAHD